MRLKGRCTAVTLVWKINFVLENSNTHQLRCCGVNTILNVLVTRRSYKTELTEFTLAALTGAFRLHFKCVFVSLPYHMPPKKELKYLCQNLIQMTDSNLFKKIIVYPAVHVVIKIVEIFISGLISYLFEIEVCFCGHPVYCTYRAYIDAKILCVHACRKGERDRRLTNV